MERLTRGAGAVVMRAMLAAVLAMGACPHAAALAENVPDDGATLEDVTQPYETEGAIGEDGANEVDQDEAEVAISDSDEVTISDSVIDSVEEEVTEEAAELGSDTEALTDSDGASSVSVEDSGVLDVTIEDEAGLIDDSSDSQLLEVVEEDDELQPQAVDSAADISTATVTVSSATYTGKALTPKVTVELGGVTLEKGTDYTLSYKGNTKVGTATVTVTGMGNYRGSKSVTFKIVQRSISKATVSKIATQAWTSKAVKPRPKITYNGKVLKLGTDYTLSYKNNVKAGSKATITIRGKGNFKGTKTVTFKIGPKTGEWRSSGGRWWYRYKDGTYPASSFVTIDGKRYYFDASGWMATGWRKVGGKWYYFSTSGAMQKSKWVGNYYVGKDGAMLTNTVTPDGYRVGKDGRWDGKGKVATSKTVRIGGISPYKMTIPARLLQNNRTYNSSRQSIVNGYTFLTLNDHQYAENLTSFYLANKGKVDLGLFATRQLSGIGTLTIYGSNDNYFLCTLITADGKKMAFSFLGAKGYPFGDDKAAYTTWENALLKEAGVSTNSSYSEANIQIAVALAKKVKFE